jgi:hypothetical protein
MTESVGKAKRARSQIKIDTADVEAYAVEPILYFPDAMFEGKKYQVFLVPTHGMRKRPVKLVDGP